MKEAGFHLIELLIVLSIVAILLTYALPNYTAYLASARRLSAETALMQLAARLEAYFEEHNSYEGASFANLKVSEWVAEKTYRLVIETETPTQFQLAALPQGKQAQQDARCGNLGLDSHGEKRSSGLGKLDECWSRF